VTVQQFSSPIDVLYLKRRDAERHRLYYKPRKWLVQSTTTSTLSIYGEPGEITSSISGTDGVTSIPATRTLTSAASNFVTAGVNITDILELVNECSVNFVSNDKDNGRYLIEQVSANALTVDRNWPVGSLNALNFRVHMLKERYQEFDHVVPFSVLLNPTVKELNRWGISEKRDARIEISIGLCDEIGWLPKIGDRFILPYGIGTRNIHYEIKNLYESDQLADSNIPLHFVGFAVRVNLEITAT